MGRRKKLRIPGLVLELQTGFAGCIGQRLDAAVVQVSATVEDDLLDALLLRALGDQLADFAAAATLPPYFFSVVFLPKEDAEARVTPLRSSMSCV